jgi:hypothetical protein
MKRTLVRGAVGLALALSLAGCRHGGHGGGAHSGHSGGGHSGGGHSGGGHSSGGRGSSGYTASGWSAGAASHRHGHSHGSPDFGRLGSHGTTMGSGLHQNDPDPDPGRFGEFTCAAKQQEWMAVHRGFGRLPPQLQCRPDGTFGSPVVYGVQPLAGAGSGEPLDLD